MENSLFVAICAKGRRTEWRLMKKIILRAIFCLLALFILLNISWYVWRAVKYGSYNAGMEENYFSTWIVPRYIQTDEDGYDYSVKYPDYLTVTGNLSVSSPTTDDNMSTDGLIIWPKFFGGYEYGVILEEGEDEYQIYINTDGSAIYPEDSETAARHQENIDALLRKAKGMWNLE